MRRIATTFCHLPGATALLAGAALLAGSGGCPARAHADGQPGAPSDDLAIAIPRLSPTGSGGEVALPQPLALSDAARVRRVFMLQAHGAMAAAEHETAQLDTTTLLGQAMLGHILADRYLGRFSKPGIDELRAWLARWPDLPDAASVHALLMSRLPTSRLPVARQHPAEGVVAAAVSLPEQTPVPEETGDAERALVRNPDLDRSTADAARHRGATGVRRLLAHTSGLSPSYRSQLSGEAGQILFTMGRDAEAYEIAAAGARACADAASDSCHSAAIAGFAAGLAAWRMGHPELARPMFDAAWEAKLTTSSLRAAAALWSSRAQLRLGNYAGHAVWLSRAAAERDTFYGLLARRMLGLSAPARAGALDGGETLSMADVEAVAAIPAGLRAFALLQVGQRGRAEAELRRLWPDMQAATGLTRAVMLVASKAEFFGLAAQLADFLQAADGLPREGTRFRIPRLRPDGGFRIDPAMVFALARTESNFNAAEVSSAGALGVMQLMPETASFIVNGFVDSGSKRRGGAGVREMLHDPSSNLALGQQYVAYLASQDGVNGDLIRLLASYNCGPSKFAQWAPGVRDLGDPLLFIEAIPIDETRAFVRRVLTYTWIYARRLHMKTPSLDELAVGVWPRYHAGERHDAVARLH